MSAWQYTSNNAIFVQLEHEYLILSALAATTKLENFTRKTFADIQASIHKLLCCYKNDLNIQSTAAYTIWHSLPLIQKQLPKYLASKKLYIETQALTPS